MNPPCTPAALALLLLAFQLPSTPAPPSPVAQATPALAASASPEGTVCLARLAEDGTRLNVLVQCGDERGEMSVPLDPLGEARVSAARIASWSNDHGGGVALALACDGPRGREYCYAYLRAEDPETWSLSEPVLRSRLDQPPFDLLALRAANGGQVEITFRRGAVAIGPALERVEELFVDSCPEAGLNLPAPGPRHLVDLRAGVRLELGETR